MRAVPDLGWELRERSMRVCFLAGTLAPAGRVAGNNAQRHDRRPVLEPRRAPVRADLCMGSHGPAREALVKFGLREGLILPGCDS